MWASYSLQSGSCHGMIAPHGPMQLTFCFFQRVPNTIKGTHCPSMVLDDVSAHCWSESIFFINWDSSSQGVRGQRADSVAQDHLDNTCRSASPMWLPETQEFIAQRKPGILPFQKNRALSLTPTSTNESEKLYWLQRQDLHPWYILKKNSWPESRGLMTTEQRN